MILLIATLATLVYHPIVYHAPLPGPPFRTGPCKNYSVSRNPNGPNVVPFVSESGVNVVLQSQIFDFSLERDGYFYYRLDNETPQYLAMAPSGKAGQALPIWFSGLRQGQHFIRYGLISRRSSNISYGEICFDVKPWQVKRFYDKTN